MIFLRKTTRTWETKSMKMKSSILAGLALLASLFLGPLVPAPALAVETDNYWLCVPLATGVNPSWCPVQKNYPLPVEVGTGYSYSIASADKSHFHHRLLRVGYTQRQAVGLLYAWSGVLAAFALAIRLFPYRTEGTWNLWPTIGLTLFGLIALFVTYYVVVALEIIKYRHLRRFGLLRHSAATDETPVPRPSFRRRARA